MDQRTLTECSDSLSADPLVDSTDTDHRLSGNVLHVFSSTTSPLVVPLVPLPRDGVAVKRALRVIDTLQVSVSTAIEPGLDAPTEATFGDLPPPVSWSMFTGVVGTAVQVSEAEHPAGPPNANIPQGHDTPNDRVNSSTI